MIDKKKIALVHIVKKELGLDDQEYRRILKSASGVTSSKELDNKKFRKLMNYFVRSKYYRSSKHGITLKQKLFIKNLAHQMEWDEEHLHNFLGKYYHKRDIDRLTKKEAIKVIESLKHIKERQ